LRVEGWGLRVLCWGLRVAGLGTGCDLQNAIPHTPACSLGGFQKWSAPAAVRPRANGQLELVFGLEFRVQGLGLRVEG